MDKKQTGKRLIVMSAPSATGKNTVFDALKVRIPQVRRAVTATTRLPRDNERDGVDYWFMTKEDFRRRAEDGAFVEQNTYDGQFYGTPKSELDSQNGEPVVLIIDVNGKEAVVNAYPEAVSVFLMPPSMEVLRERITSRKQNSEEEIERRLTIARQEMDGAKTYDYVLVNDDVDRCADAFADIVRAVCADKERHTQ